jgi:hypothetical protein
VVIEAERNRLPVGIMNVEQALALPGELDANFSHTDHEPGVTNLFVDRRELVSKVCDGK